MTYFLTIKHRDGSIIINDAPFQTLQDAIDYIFAHDYLTPAAEAFRNNAYVCVDENGISNLVISTTSAGFNNIHPDVRTISIKSEAARICAAKRLAKDKTTH
jgi:hypothetical protein